METPKLVFIIMGNICRCGEFLHDTDVFDLWKLQAGTCNAPCRGDETLTCGGSTAFDLYELVVSAGTEEGAVTAPVVAAVAGSANQGEAGSAGGRFDDVDMDDTDDVGDVDDVDGSDGGDGRGRGDDEGEDSDADDDETLLAWIAHVVFLFVAWFIVAATVLKVLRFGMPGARAPPVRTSRVGGGVGKSKSKKNGKGRKRQH